MHKNYLKVEFVPYDFQELLESLKTKVLTKVGDGT